MYCQEGHQILYSLSFSYLMGFSITNHIDGIYSLPFWKHFKVESMLSYNLEAERGRKKKKNAVAPLGISSQ